MEGLSYFYLNLFSDGIICGNWFSIRSQNFKITTNSIRGHFARFLKCVSFGY